jgi:hypothetical protein
VSACATASPSGSATSNRKLRDDDATTREPRNFIVRHCTSAQQQSDAPRCSIASLRGPSNDATWDDAEQPLTVAPLRQPIHNGERVLTAGCACRGLFPERRRVDAGKPPREGHRLQPRRAACYARIAHTRSQRVFRRRSSEEHAADTALAARTASSGALSIFRVALVSGARRRAPARRRRRRQKRPCASRWSRRVQRTRHVSLRQRQASSRATLAARASRAALAPHDARAVDVDHRQRGRHSAGIGARLLEHNRGLRDLEQQLSLLHGGMCIMTASQCVTFMTRRAEARRHSSRCVAAYLAGNSHLCC